MNRFHSAAILLGFLLAGACPGADVLPPQAAPAAATIASTTESDPPLIMEPVPPAAPAGGVTYLEPLMQPGDHIRISLREDEDVTFDGQISSAGLVFLPYLGKFLIAGKGEREAEKALQEALTKELYETAHLSVVIVKRAPGQVYIYGAVKQPGRIELPEFGQKTILQAIAESGGVTNWAALADAYILRRGPGGAARTRIPVDLSKALTVIEDRANVALRNNDVIYIPTSTGFDSTLSNEKIEVLITGQVETPGMVTFDPGEQRTFLRAIFKAGSFTRFAKKKQVRLIHYEPDGKRSVKTIDAERMIDEGFLEEDVPVQAGDLIIVDQKRINF